VYGEQTPAKLVEGLLHGFTTSSSRVLSLELIAGLNTLSL
jgi:hypothetical protein